MTGWRLGYMAGPVSLVKAMTKIQSQSTSSPNSISQMAAVAALTGDQTIVAERREAFRHRRQIIVQELAQIPGLSCRNPGGAFYVFLGVGDLFGRTAAGKALRNATDVTEYFLDQARVVTVSGEGFGDQEHIRLTYAVSVADISAATSRIGSAVAQLE